MRNTALGKEVYGAFSYGNTLNQVIILNLFVFLGTLFLNIGFRIAQADVDVNMHKVLQWIELPLDSYTFITRPYTLFTYMFLHVDFLHFLGNMFALYIFGRIFREFLGGKRLLPVYILGGLTGGIVTLLYNIFLPDTLFSGSALIGASASVMAVVMALAFLYPDLPLHIIFLGPVRLKYIALFYVILDLVGMASLSNAGGHLAHMGGMLFGIFYALEFKRKRDLAAGFILLMEKLGGNKKEKQRVKMKVSYRRALSDEEYNTMKVEQEATLDDILDKITQKGFKSLSKKEKELLDKYSKE